MKTSYHPAILVGFYLNCLPADLQNQIPRSTRFDWRHKKYSLLFGYDWFCQNQALFNTIQAVSNNKRLIRVNQTLLRIIAIKRFIIKYASQVREKLFMTCSTIVYNIEKVKKVIGLTISLKMLQLSYRCYQSLKRTKKCTRSILDLCRIKHPSQLLRREIAIIKDYCLNKRFLYWPFNAVYHQIRRDNAAFFGIRSFYKYVALLQLNRTLACHRRKNHFTGVRAAAPLQIIHADITIFRTTDNARSCIYLVQDNFSRAILASSVEDNCTASTVFNNLSHVYQESLAPAGITKCTIVTDNGSENQQIKKLSLENKSRIDFQHLVAQKDVTFSNSMIEAANKQLKYRFLYHYPIANQQELKVYLKQAVDDFNNRPHHVLNGLSPNEVLKGKLPATINYTTQVMQAALDRTAENRKMACCYYTF